MENNNRQQYDTVLSVEKEKNLLTQRVAESKNATFTANQKNKYDPFPLTDIQHAYWIGSGDTYELGNTACHSYFELSGRNIDVARLEKAVNELIQRHDMLRAIINRDGSQQILKKAPYYKITVSENDSNIADDKHFIHLVRNAMSHQRFDYEQWPLFDIRVSIYADCFILHCSFDLIVLDAFSIHNLLFELACRYKNINKKWPELSISFRDWVEYEKQEQSSANYQLSLEYWRNKFGQWPGIPQLPLKTQPAGIKNPHFIRKQTYLKEELWSNIKKYARKHQLTSSSVLLGAFTDVLRKWSTSEDFLLNMTVFNRPPVHTQINEVLGDFTSSLILEVLKDSAPFAQRVKSLQSLLWKDFSHRRVSGVRVLRELASRNSSVKYVPIVFTSLLGHEQVEQLSVIEETFGEFQYGISQTPQVWIDHQVSEKKGRLFLTWDYNEELFPADMIEDMFGAYVAFLENLAVDPDIWESEHIELLPDNQKQIINEANSTSDMVPQECLHELFLKQAQITPRQNAIFDNDLVMDYETLLGVVKGLAEKLTGKGVCRGDNVAIVMDKGWEQVAAVLAVNYIGAAYVPIDVKLPEARRLYLLEVTCAKFVLLQPHAEQTINTELPVIVVRQDIKPSQGTVPEPVYSPDGLAYIIFTSGSTGAPKGVAVTHRGAVNTILDINKKFSVGSEDKVLALSALNFDLSVYDIYGLLAVGGGIVFPRNDGLRDPAHWLELIDRHAVTLWNTVPALMGMLVSYMGYKTEDLQTLKTVLLSGDWIPIDLPESIKRYACNAKVISLGGATEASIWSIYYPIDRVDSSLPSIPYGKPLTNQTFHVLDKDLNECPIWVPGDLYIGGVGLAHSYWADPDKTAEKFIIHPVSNQRLYKTGDIGRYLNDGNIEFLGRDDYQIKIQGFRVELGEIESTLLEHPQIRNAVVMAKGDAGHKKLIAYVVHDDNKQAINKADNTFYDESGGRRLRNARHAASATAEDKPFDEDHLSAVMNKLEEISLIVIQRNFYALGVFTEKGEKHSLSDILQQCAIDPRYEKLVRQWAEVLKKEGFLKEDNNGKIVNETAFEPRTFEDEWLYLESSPIINNEFLEYLKLSFEHQIDLLQGKVSPLELFFPHGSWDRALGLYESNPLSKYYNSILVAALRAYITGEEGGDKLHILEVGAGTGGTTAGILPEINGNNVHYVFSDLTTFFTDRARQRFSAYDFVDYKILNIDKDPLQQGFNAAEFDVVIASNVLHDAHNINKTLHNLAGILKPNGILLVREATQNSITQMVSVGFIEGFSGYQDERARENLPLLSAPQWMSAFERAGFKSSSAYPAAEWPFRGVQESVLIAESSSGRTVLSSDELYAYLRDRLPEYMVPDQYIVLDEIPLTSQGKIDRKALPVPDQIEKVDRSVTYAAPQTDMQKTITAVWQEILKKDKVGIDDNFFDVGGDSLYLTIMTAELEKRLDLEISITELFRFPTVRALANYLMEKKPSGGSLSGSQRGVIRKTNRQRRQSARQITANKKEIEHV